MSEAPTDPRAQAKYAESLLAKGATNPNPFLILKGLIETDPVPEGNSAGTLAASILLANQKRLSDAQVQTLMQMVFTKINRTTAVSLSLIYLIRTKIIVDHFHQNDDSKKLMAFVRENKADEFTKLADALFARAEDDDDDD